MSRIYGKSSSAAMTGLAIICIAMAIASFVGQRSVARLTSEHAENQNQIAALRGQIDHLNHVNDEQTANFDRDLALAENVGGAPVSRVVAYVAARLPIDCRVETIQFDQSRKTVAVRIRCADVCTFDAHQRFKSSVFRTNFRSIGDRSGIGFGWSQDRSAVGVLSVPLPPPPTGVDALTIAN